MPNLNMTSIKAGSFCSFQVIKEWNEIELVLIDDFLEKGNEQVLFLPQNISISESKGFSFHVVFMSIGCGGTVV